MRVNNKVQRSKDLIENAHTYLLILHFISFAHRRLLIPVGFPEVRGIVDAESTIPDSTILRFATTSSLPQALMDHRDEVTGTGSAPSRSDTKSRLTIRFCTYGNCQEGKFDSSLEAIKCTANRQAYVKVHRSMKGIERAKLKRSCSFAP